MIRLRNKLSQRILRIEDRTQQSDGSFILNYIILTPKSFGKPFCCNDEDYVMSKYGSLFEKVMRG